MRGSQCPASPDGGARPARRAGVRDRRGIAACLGARCVAATGGADDPKGDGVVSSGVALPPIPKVTGSRSAPVASWGKPLPYPFVIDRKTKEFIWQYGETDKTGHKPGLLFYPDGFDIDVFRDRKSAGR